jgi:hypothetical protein
MKVSEPFGKETLDDDQTKEAAYAGADRSEASGWRCDAQLEISESTYDRWRRQYGGMKAEGAKRLKELEEENRRLKQLVAEKELDIQMLKHVAEGDW